MLIDTSDTAEVEVIVSDSEQCLRRTQRIPTGEFSEFISIYKYYKMYIEIACIEPSALAQAS